MSFSEWRAKKNIQSSQKKGNNKNDRDLVSWGKVASPRHKPSPRVRSPAPPAKPSPDDLMRKSFVEDQPNFHAT
jgi:hypothetical protein